MRYLLQSVRRYPLALACVAVIWYLSFFHTPKTPLDDVRFIDKWVHITMYGGTFTVMWIEYLRAHGGRIVRHWSVALKGWLAPVVMSGVIELLQEYCTNGRRSGDWLDLAANATGVTLAAVIGLAVERWRATRRKDGA